MQNSLNNSNINNHSQFMFPFTFTILVLLVLDAVYFENIPNLLRSAVRNHYHGKMRLAIVTRFPEGEPQLTRTNFESYCARHNYDLIVLNDFDNVSQSYRDTIGFASRPYAFIKKIMMAPSMTNHKLYDWIMWADWDTIFVNQKVNLERIIDKRYSFILPSQSPEIADAVPSLSHFMVRNNKDGLQILNDLDKLASEHCGQFILKYPGAATALNGWLHICNSDGTFWNGDQGLLLAVLTFTSPDYRCRFKRIAHRIMDSQFPSYSEQDLAISFPDHTTVHKQKLIRLFLDNVDCKSGRRWRRQSFPNQLDPVDPGLGDWRALEAIYEANLNVPCDDL